MSKSNKKFSFLVPTYNRPDKLSELLYWFQRQTAYEDSELLILADDGHEYVTPCPNTRILPCTGRIPTLGLKRNILIDFAVGEILIPQDDDDIPLPHRAEQANEKLKEHTYFDPGARWFEDRGTLHHTHAQNCTVHAIAFKRGAVRYPENRSVDADLYLTRDAKSIAPKLTSPSEWSYVYRWGVSRDHLSGFSGEYYPSIPPPVSRSRFIIEPEKRRDYAVDCLRIASSA